MALPSSEPWFSTERVYTGKLSSILSAQKRERYARKLRKVLADYPTSYTASPPKIDKA
jgi:hypothetical protein